MAISATTIRPHAPSGDLAGKRDAHAGDRHTVLWGRVGFENAFEVKRARLGCVASVRCPPLLIAVLLFSEVTIAKLAAHAIGPEEVRQVSDGDRVVIANPRPRVDRVGVDDRPDARRPACGPLS